MIFYIFAIIKRTCTQTIEYVYKKTTNTSSIPLCSVPLRSIICECMASLSTVGYLHLKLYVHPFQDIVRYVRVIPS